MNKKISIGLLLCIVVSIFVIWYKSNPGKFEAINFEEVTQADKIEIINQKDTLVIFKKENQWISKNELEISQNQIEKFQNIIQNLQFKSYPTKNFYQNLQQKSSITANIYQKNGKTVPTDLHNYRKTLLIYKYYYLSLIFALYFFKPKATTAIFLLLQ